MFLSFFLSVSQQNLASKVIHVSTVDDLAKLGYRSPIDHLWGGKERMYYRPNMYY